MGTISQLYINSYSKGFTNYNPPSSTVTIRASCQTCVPTKLTIPNAPVLSRPEETYRADMQTCQVPSSSATSGKNYFSKSIFLMSIFRTRKGFLLFLSSN